MLSTHFARLAFACTMLFAALTGVTVVLGRAVGQGTRLTGEVTVGGNVDLYAFDVERGLMHRLTRHPAVDYDASWSPDGSRLTFFSRRELDRGLYLLTIGGGVRRLLDEASIPTGYRAVWSPDGRFLVYEVDYGSLTTDLYVLEVDVPRVEGVNPRNLTDERFTADRYPVWSRQGDAPQDDRIAFVSWRNGLAEIFTIKPDGSDLLRLMPNQNWNFNPSWSPDGKQIAFFSSRQIYRELYVMDRDGGNVRQLSHANALNYGQGSPVWSPDGMRIAYQVVVEGYTEIMVIGMDDESQQRVPHPERVAGAPIWLSNRVIAYSVSDTSGSDRRIYATDLDSMTFTALTPPLLRTGSPVLWN